MNKQTFCYFHTLKLNGSSKNWYSEGEEEKNIKIYEWNSYSVTGGKDIHNYDKNTHIDQHIR